MRHTLLLCLLLTCGCITYGQPYYLNSFYTGDPGTENWSNLGPSESEYGPGLSIDRGRINAIWVNHNDQNSILAGADGGGLWKSNDGGQNWRSLTDQLASASSNVFGMNGITGIAVDPLDSNTIYLALNNSSQYKKSGGYGLGLIYTTDGGNTWQQDPFFVPPAQVTKVAFMPGINDLFAITSGSNLVYMKGDG